MVVICVPARVVVAHELPARCAARALVEACVHCRVQQLLEFLHGDLPFRGTGAHRGLQAQAGGGHGFTARVEPPPSSRRRAAELPRMGDRERKESRGGARAVCGCEPKNPPRDWPPKSLLRLLPRLLPPAFCSTHIESRLFRCLDPRVPGPRVKRWAGDRAVLPPLSVEAEPSRRVCVCCSAAAAAAW